MDAGRVRHSGRTFFPWLGTGAWAVVDQALFSGSNFVLNVMLARWLGPAEYGVFGVVYSVLLFMGTAQTAFMIEPMLVFGPKRYRGRFATYVDVLLRGHWQLSAITAVIPAVVGLVVFLTASRTLGVALLVCAVAGPLVLLGWLLRKACYVHLQPRVAAEAGFVYLGAMLAGILTLQRFDLLSATSAVALLGVASLASVQRLLVHLRSFSDDDPGGNEDLRREAPAAHWRYGRWGVGAVLLGWVASDVYYLGLTALHGFEATGLFRAAMNLILPAKQTFVALGTVALPILVAARAAHRLGRTALLIGAAFLAAAAIYATVLVLFADPLTDLLYGASYEGVVGVALILALFPLGLSAVRVVNITLHALEDPRGVFAGSVPSAVLAFSVGMLMMWLWGAHGAAVAIVLGSFATVTAMGIILVRRLRGRT